MISLEDAVDRVHARCVAVNAGQDGPILHGNGLDATRLILSGTDLDAEEINSGMAKAAAHVLGLVAAGAPAVPAVSGALLQIFAVGFELGRSS